MELTVEKMFYTFGFKWQLPEESQEKLRNIWPHFQPRSVGVTHENVKTLEYIGLELTHPNMYNLLALLTGMPVELVRADVPDLQVLIEFKVKPPT